MLGQTVSLLNKMMAGRITGAPWWRDVRKGIIFRNPVSHTDKDSFISSRNLFPNILSMYKNYKGTVLNREKKAATYFLKPGQAFKDNYDRLFTETNETAMFFMYNPTQWQRSVRSGYEEIKIPGGTSIYHQASIPSQTFSLELLLDNSLWNNSDSLVEALADHAVGALSRGIGDAMGAGDLGLRELQFYHYPSDQIDPFFSKPGMTNYASLAPIIHWYETLCRPDPTTQKCPEVFVVYQDMFAQCIVESCTTTILKSDWRQNINRATVALNFIVLENLNFDRGVLHSEKDLLSAAIA